jgi:hypothetical protein
MTAVGMEVSRQLLESLPELLLLVTGQCSVPLSDADSTSTLSLSPKSHATLSKPVAVDQCEDSSVDEKRRRGDEIAVVMTVHSTSADKESRSSEITSLPESYKEDVSPLVDADSLAAFRFAASSGKRRRSKLKHADVLPKINSDSCSSRGRDSCSSSQEHVSGSSEGYDSCSSRGHENCCSEGHRNCSSKGQDSCSSSQGHESCSSLGHVNCISQEHENSSSKAHDSCSSRAVNACSGAVCESFAKTVSDTGSNQGADRGSVPLEDSCMVEGEDSCMSMLPDIICSSRKECMDLVDDTPALIPPPPPLLGKRKAISINIAEGTKKILVPSLRSSPESTSALIPPSSVPTLKTGLAEPSSGELLHITVRQKKRSRKALKKKKLERCPSKLSNTTGRVRILKGLQAASGIPSFLACNFNSERIAPDFVSFLVLNFKMKDFYVSQFLILKYTIKVLKSLR